jgi:hypothetical protein
MCASHRPHSSEWCETFKKIEAGEKGVVTDSNGSTSVSLVFAEKKLVQVLVQGKADWAKSMTEFTQKYGAPDSQTTNSAAWSFGDGGGISITSQPGDLFIATFYSKDAHPNDEAKTTAPAANNVTAQKDAPPPSPSLGGHVIGESVNDFAAKVGVDMVVCRELNFSAKPRDLDKQAKKLHVFADTCRGLINAEQGRRLEIGKENEWSAILDGGKLVSYNDGRLDTTKIISADKLPSAPSDSYEIKGDKLGISTGEYLRLHPSDCVSASINPKTGKNGPKPADPNSFHFSCTNFGLGQPPLTLATYRMSWQVVDFSQQRLYRVAYEFNHDLFPVIQESLELKFGQPTSLSQEDVQNGFGAHFKRSTVIWKNGISTITLREMAVSDLTLSQVEMTLDDVYSAVLQHEGSKTIKAAQKDM